MFGCFAELGMVCGAVDEYVCVYESFHFSSSVSFFLMWVLAVSFGSSIGGSAFMLLCKASVGFPYVVTGRRIIWPL